MTAARWIPWAGSVGMIVLFLAQPIAAALPQRDLWWMLPALDYYLRQPVSSPFLPFLLSPSPRIFEFPVHKLYFWFFDHQLRWPFWSWIASGIALHMVNAVLLAMLARRMGLSRRVSQAAGLIFLTLFVHFDALLWPVSHQHLVSLFSMEVLLLLYFRSLRCRESRITWLAALAAAVFASFQQGAWVGPFLVFFHLMVCSPTPRERWLRIRRWLPILLTSFLYPALCLSMSTASPMITTFVKMRAAVWLKLGLVAALGAAGLLGVAGWCWRGRASAGRVGGNRRLWGGLGILGVFALSLWDSRQVLFPYNALAPLNAILASFMDPFGTAMQMDSANYYFLISPRVTPVFLLLLLAAGITFLRVFVRRKKDLLMLIAWYGFCLLFFLLQKHVASSMPSYIYSRHFMYLTPLFSIVLASGLVYGMVQFARRRGWRLAVLDRWIAVLLLLLGGVNLCAIRAAAQRGSLMNSYFSYQDFRTGRLVRDDLARRGRLGSVSPEQITVESVVPMWFPIIPWSVPIPQAEVEFYDFRLSFSEGMRDPRMRGVQIAQVGAPLPAGAVTYRIDGPAVRDSSGRAIEPFETAYESGVAQMLAGNNEKALEYFRQAARERPFLLNYLLTQQGRPEDLRWITGGLDLRSWIHWMNQRNRRWGIVPVRKWQETSSLLDAELDRYVRTLFYVSFLEERAGRGEVSQVWLSKIRGLEISPKRLGLTLREGQGFGSVPGLAAFMDQTERMDFLPRPPPSRSGDNGFGRFLERWAFGSLAIRLLGLGLILWIGWRWAAQRMRWSRRASAAVLLAGALAFVFSSFAATRVMLWRGRLMQALAFSGGSRAAPWIQESPDPFVLKMEEAQADWDAGRPEEAKQKFQQAALQRPRFFRYLLEGRRLRLEDLRWLTGKKDLRTWLFDLEEGMDPALQKGMQPTLREIHSEISSYILCFVWLSFLESQAGDLPRARFWLSTVQLLEREPDSLMGWVPQAPVVAQRPALRQFVERLRDPVFFTEPLFWKKDDYIYGRFLIRLVSGKEIISKWDWRFKIIL